VAQYLELQERDIQEIVSRYKLNLLEFTSIEVGAGNTNYLVSTNQHQYILTIFEIDQLRVEKLCRLLKLLAENKFPTTQVHKLENGSELTSYQGKPVVLKPYISGQVKKKLKGKMLDQLGEALAKLHAIPNPSFLSQHHAYGKETFHHLIGQDKNRGYEKWLQQKYAYLNTSIPPFLPNGLIHGDLFYDNVLFEGKKLKAILDFEEACHYFKIFDLGMCIVGCCTKEAEVKLKKARSLVSGYQKLRVLEKQEKESLKLFVEYAAIATSSWRFWKHNIDTPIASKSDQYLEMVNLANAMGSMSNDEFVDTVFDRKTKRAT
jgi:homoserine kinase type II